MANDIGQFAYSFDKSYYENYYSNRLSRFNTSGSFNDMFVTQWLDLNDGRMLDGVEIDNGVDITQFVQYQYNGDQRKCLYEKIAIAIAGAVKDIAAAVCGVLEFLIEVVNSVIDFFVDIFSGSFVCTATLRGAGHEMSEIILDELKAYRDDVLTDADGKMMLKYYAVYGPKIVEQIDADSESEAVYTYIMSDYIYPIRDLIEEDKKSEVIRKYLELIDDMMVNYDMNQPKKFIEWKKEYAIEKESLNG